MPIETRGLDHIIICVRDPEAAAMAYRRMGFTLAPAMFHPMGTANRLIMFEKDFLELLYVAEPAKLNQHSQGIVKLLGKREGLWKIAFLSTDAAHDRKDFEENGLAPSEVFHFRRPVTLPDGRETAAEVDVVTADPAPPWPMMGFFVSHQQVPEAIWVKDWQSHSNGAQALESVAIVHDDPSGMAEYFVRCLGPRSIVRSCGKELVVQTPNGIIDVVDPDGFQRRYDAAAEAERPYVGGVEIRVQSLRVLQQILDREQVPHRSRRGATLVHPRDCAGAALRFVEAGRQL